MVINPALVETYQEDYIHSIAFRKKILKPLQQLEHCLACQHSSSSVWICLHAACFSVELDGPPGQRSQSNLTSVYCCYMMYSRLPASLRRISVLYLHAVNRLDRGDSLLHCEVTVSCHVLRRKCCWSTSSLQDCDSPSYQLHNTPFQCDKVYSSCWAEQHFLDIRAFEG